MIALMVGAVALLALLVVIRAWPRERFALAEEEDRAALMVSMTAATTQGF